MAIANTEKISDRQAFGEYELPQGWDILPLGHCVDILDNLRIPVNSEERKTRHGSIPYYGATGQVGWIDDFLFDEELLLLGEDGAPFLEKPKTVAYIIEGKSWVNNHAHVLRAIQGLTTNKFLKYYLNKFDFSDFVTGSTRLKLTQGAMKKIPVIVPPLAEQSRIVAKMEELLASVNSTKERLSKVLLILRRFRQSVLAAVCSGRLTADWRENNPVSESVEALLENIKRRRLQQAITTSQKQQIDALYSNQEEGDSNSLPERWTYLALDKLCESLQYGTSKKSEPIGKVAVLRMGNIQNGEIDWSDLVYTSDAEEIEKYKLNLGDVLFNRTNSPELVGKAAIYSAERPAIFAGYLIKINNFEELDSRYLNFCLNTIYARDYCLKVKTDGVSQSNINARKLGKFEVPFCPLEEQHEIVRRVESMFKLADAVGERVALATTRTERLTQAILAKAFRGELVPTEAELARREGGSYEPASELLARIKSERESKQALQKIRRNRNL